MILDEKKGRKVAQSLQLPFTGLGGVLIRAKQSGLISEVREYLTKIEVETGFYLSAAAKGVILKAAGE